MSHFDSIKTPSLAKSLLGSMSRRRTQAYRRTVLGVLVAAFAGLASTLAMADSYPSKSIRLVVGSPPGALGDLMARIVSDKLATSLGQSVFVENKPGASGAIAAATVAKAPADGHTLLLAHDGVVTANQFIYSSLQYSPDDLVPLGVVGKSSPILVVHPSLGVKSVEELVALAKAKPNTITYGSGGNGHSTHLGMELMSDRLGIKMMHVPYRGTSPSILAVVSGEVSVAMMGVAEAAAHSQAGRILTLAAAGPSARGVMPGLPELRDLHPDLDMDVWFGIFAPAGTDQAIVDRLSRELATVVQHPDLHERTKSYGIVHEAVSSQELAAQIKRESSNWGPIIKGLNLTLD